MLNALLISGLFSVILLSTGCEGDFFGEKTSKDFLDTPVRQEQTAGYVPIQPSLSDLQKPVDVIVGYDELIYVADEETESIVQYDLSGTRLGSFKIPGLKSIAQDRRLDLLAIGTLDTTINGESYKLSTIYRIDMIDGNQVDLSNATVKNKIIHPFYFKSGISSADEPVAFEDLDFLANHKFYVTRTGPSNNSGQFGGPDNAVLLFNARDTFETPIQIKTQSGIFSDYFEDPKGITTRVKPPQSADADQSGDFVFTSLAPDRTLKVQYIERIASENGVSYEFRQLTTGDTSQADGFLYEANKFNKPYDVTIAGDNTNYIFVVDRQQDSLYQFTNTGLEGVDPPPGSNADQVIQASFGGTGNGPKEFRNPSGVAYYQETVYVADAGNGRVLRFKLSSDLN